MSYRDDLGAAVMRAEAAEARARVIAAELEAAKRALFHGPSCRFHEAKRRSLRAVPVFAVFAGLLAVAAVPSRNADGSTAASICWLVCWLVGMFLSAIWVGQ